MEAIFTHQYIPEFGFENTIYLHSDFKEVEELGRNDIDGVIFLGTFDSGKTIILKGFYGEINYKTK